ncbi:dirigent protein 22-like [Coffea eugenioides]|uniref:Dirigent protein n=1 Tax=Coffea arabica TaxID=13443 RepID=A0A6P6W5H5_COFAR|nr:dirigent protein 22-like [Coffea arabica]XP_027158664.1 dirigent protein 22-like [Coffea eugenioides]
MAKQIQAFLLICLILIIAVAVAVVDGTTAQGGPEESVDEWFHKLGRAKEKVTKLHFYFHDTVGGKSPTAVRVASANTTFTSSLTYFGLVVMFDDPLTAGPEITSTVLGKAQGFYASTDQNELGLAMYVNYHFTTGEHKGSTLTLVGRNAVDQKTREMSIVGGTGVFRLARGIATAKTYFQNSANFDAIVEYNLVVVHY